MEGEWASRGARLPALLLALLGLGPGECGGDTDTGTDTGASRRVGCWSHRARSLPLHPSPPPARRFPPPLLRHSRPNESFGNDPQLHPHPLVPNAPPESRHPPARGGREGSGSEAAPYVKQQ